MSPETRLYIREHILAERVKNVPCATLIDAKQLIGYALRCIDQSRHQFDAVPKLARTLEMVRGWIDGGQMEDYSSEVRDAAADLGPFHHGMVGRQAAYWSVWELHEAANATDQNEFSDAAGFAGLTAFFARRSTCEQGLTLEAIEIQESLLNQIFC